MSMASRTYYKIAQDTENKIASASEPDKKELRKVAAQNYFYSSVEAIESILKKSGISIYSINNHKERLDILKKNSRQFKDPSSIIMKYEIMVNYDYRRKVAYKGENGNKFLLVKEFADLCQKELE